MSWPCRRVRPSFEGVLVTSAAAAAVAGLAFGLSLIVAIGAQNAYVLRQGLRARHVGVVVAVCVVSDALLIAAGVAGMGALVAGLPALETALRIAGAVFLLGYGLLAARRALRGSAVEADGEAGDGGLMATVGTIVALTWLNPHVYLDTVVLLGTVAARYGEERWWFGAGAAVGSTAWFATLGYGAARLRPLLARPGTWRILDAVIATVMIGLAVMLVAGAG